MKCPKCGSDIVKRRTKKGRLFYSCERYPDCDYVNWRKPTVKSAAKEAVAFGGEAGKVKT